MEQKSPHNAVDCGLFHIPPDLVVDGAAQRVRATHTLISR